MHAKAVAHALNSSEPVADMKGDLDLQKVMVWRADGSKNAVPEDMWAQFLELDPDVALQKSMR